MPTNDPVAGAATQAVIGNVGSILAFRIGAEDAQTLHRELGTDAQVLLDTPDYHAWLKRSLTPSKYEPCRRSLHAVASVPSLTERGLVMRIEDMIKNAEKFQKELGEGEFSGSPWNSPQAQHARLADARVQYLDRRAQATRQVVYAALLFCLALFIYFTAPLGIPPQVGWVAAAAIGGFLGYGVYLFSKDPPDDQYKCPHCDAPTLLHAPWVCGHCRTTHRPTLTSRKPPTWAEACSKCKNVAHSLFCFHCHMPSVFHQLNFFRCPTEGAHLEGHPPQPVKPKGDMEKRLEGILK